MVQNATLIFFFWVIKNFVIRVDEFGRPSRHYDIKVDIEPPLRRHKGEIIRDRKPAAYATNLSEFILEFSLVLNSVNSLWSPPTSPTVNSLMFYIKTLNKKK